MSVQSSHNYGNKFTGQFLDALFGNEKTSKTKKAHSSNKASKSSTADMFQLSPQTQLRSIISEFKQSSASNLQISIKVKADKPLASDETQFKLSEKADKMLRMISRSDEEYQELKSGFEKMFKTVAGNFNDTPTVTNRSNSASSASVSIEETAGEISINNGNSTQTLKFSSYKLTMNFTQTQSEANAEAVESKSIASAFTQALSSFFGHSSEESVSAEASVDTAKSSVTNTSSSMSSSRMRLQELALAGCDPIVLDLSGEGINLTEAGKGAKFDINADGKTDSTAWVAGNTAMLVYDKNGNNVIDNGSELFGDQNGAADGFKELAKYDDNKDGVINSKDQIYKNLKLYRDLNGDGLMSEDEFSTLKEMGIKSLNLDCKEVDEDVNGNSIVLSGSFEREDGSKGKMADAIFGYQEL